jgi:drug/metabolite transporter (DMT)-like permease
VNDPQRDNSPGGEHRAGPGLSGPASALAAAALFGAGTPAAKLLLSDINPVMLWGLLYLGAALALSAPWLANAARRGEAPLGRHDLPLLAAIAVFGGILGPILLLTGLSRLSAVSAALLLNLEAPFTVLIAIGVMREHLGARQAIAVSVILAGAVFIAVGPGDIRADAVGVLEVAAACLCWGLDNNLTQRISLRDPIAVARIKALTAGGAAAAIALWQGVHPPDAVPILWALLTGALCYGVSIVLDLKALRVLGAAREAGYFATAPFVGAIASVLVYREMPGPMEIAGALLMAAGVIGLLRERHSHVHVHDPLVHEHIHDHDDPHHRHRHEDPVVEPHSHTHTHPFLIHEHPHFPDLHHRHPH